VIEPGRGAREALAALRRAVRHGRRSDRVELLELISEARSLSTTFEGKSVTAREGCEVCVSYVASWMRHIDASVDVITYLQERSLSIHAAPIQRLMVEHAVAAAMLAKDPQAWEAFLRDSTQGAKKIKAQLESHDIEPTAEITDFIQSGLEEEQQSYKRHRQIRNRFESLGDNGRRFYLLWLEATQLSHSGAPTASAYLRDTPGDEWPTVTQESQIQLDAMSMNFTTLDALLWCCESFSAMLIDDPLIDAVVRIQQRRDTLLDRLKV
jgi:hypothetical protein